jgi:hypothetical protein
MNNWPLQRNVDEFYGDPRGANGTYNPRWAAANIAHVHCPWPLYVGPPAQRKAAPYIQIHRLCSASLERVLSVIRLKLSDDQIHQLGYDVYDGSFNYRPIRGKKAGILSMHSYAIAVDFDAADNPYRSKKHRFNENSPIVQAFEAEGWTWGGRWLLATDAMHFQAARI